MRYNLFVRCNADKQHQQETEARSLKTQISPREELVRNNEQKGFSLLSRLLN